MDKTEAKSNKKKYQRPMLRKYGDIAELTKASSAPSLLDGGAQPNFNSMMNP